MDKEKSDEMSYKLYLTFINKLVSKNLITGKEYNKMKKKLLEKYDPYISKLLD